MFKDKIYFVFFYLAGIILSGAKPENINTEFTSVYQRTKVDASIFLYSRATFF